jgi:hypothetical protein
MSATSVAHAATTRGDISRIDATRHLLTLDNGSTFFALTSANLSRFKVGEKVSVAYALRHGKLDALAIRPASMNGNNPGLNANLGG